MLSVTVATVGAKGLNKSIAVILYCDKIPAFRFISCGADSLLVYSAVKLMH